MRERGRGGHEAGLRRGKLANNGGKSGFLGTRLNQVSPHLHKIDSSGRLASDLFSYSRLA